MADKNNYCVIAVYGGEKPVLDAALEFLEETENTYEVFCTRDELLLVYPKALSNGDAESAARALSERTGVCTAAAYGIPGADCRFAVYRRGEAIASADYKDGRRLGANGIEQLAGNDALSLPELAFLPWDADQERTDDWEQLVCRDIFHLSPTPPPPDRGFYAHLDETASSEKISVYFYRKKPLSEFTRYYQERIKLLFGSARSPGILEKISRIPELIKPSSNHIGTENTFPPYELELPRYIKRPNYYEILPDGRIIPCEDPDAYYSGDTRYSRYEPFIPSCYCALYTSLEELGYRQIGIDGSGQVYVWAQGKGIYIFDVELTYCNFEPTAEDFIAFYLNKAGDMCMLFTCGEDGAAAMDACRVSCKPYLPDKLLPPLKPPVENVNYASCHIRRGGKCTVPSKLIKLLSERPGRSYRILREESGRFLSLYGVEYEEVCALALELSVLLQTTVLATYGTKHAYFHVDDKLSVFSRGELIVEMGHHEGIPPLTNSSRGSTELLNDKRMDPWTRKQVTMSMYGDLYSNLIFMHLYGEFPDTWRLRVYQTASEIAAENIEVITLIRQAQPWDKDQREKMRPFFLSAAAGPDAVELSHLRGELADPCLLRWLYMPQNQRLTLYNYEGYLNERELASYGIAPDGAVVPWDESMAERRAELPNFSALERFSEEYDMKLPYDYSIIGIDGRDRIYIEHEKNGIYITDRDLTACKLVKFTKGIEGWYQNEAGEFCFFARNRSEYAKPDNWVYKIVFDSEEGGGDIELG